MALLTVLEAAEEKLSPVWDWTRSRADHYVKLRRVAETTNPVDAVYIEARRSVRAIMRDYPAADDGSFSAELQEALDKSMSVFHSLLDVTVWSQAPAYEGITRVRDQILLAEEELGECTSALTRAKERLAKRAPAQPATQKPESPSPKYTSEQMFECARKVVADAPPAKVAYTSEQMLDAARKVVADADAARGATLAPKKGRRRAPRLTKAERADDNIAF